MAAKIEAALDTDINDLYFVGHNARNFLYGFPKVDKVYQFILSERGVIPNSLATRLEDLDGYQRDEGDTSDAFIKGTDYDVRIWTQPINEYLLSAAFAGDGIAIHVVSGRLIVIPEYLTLDPIEQIRDRSGIGLPLNPMLADTKEALAWKLDHRAKLGAFKEATTKLAASLANEPR